MIVADHKYFFACISITELRSSGGSSAQSQMQSIRGKLTTLGVTYAGSERFFPLEYLVQLLEQHSCNKGWDVDFVYKVMLEIGVSVRALFTIYDKMFKAKVSHFCLMLWQILRSWVVPRLS